MLILRDRVGECVGEQERVGSMTNGVQFLEMCGFAIDESGEFLVISREKVDLLVLNTAGGELTSAISNPFFGIL